ncbi:uncharacterized protein LOC144432858 [Glandiceps talaboti]
MWNTEKSKYSRLEGGSHSPNQSTATSQSMSSQASTVVRVKKTSISSSQAPIKDRTGAGHSAGSKPQHRLSAKGSRSKHSQSKFQKEKEKMMSSTGAKHKTCKEHVFLTDVADVRQMEKGLLQMLDDFHSGRLQAFGRECSFEHMDNVRDLQEKLSRLHFDLDSQQQTHGHGLGSDEAKETAGDHMEQLMVNLEQLSTAIQSLHPSEGNPSAVGGR